MKKLLISLLLSLFFIASCATLNPNTGNIRTVSQDYKGENCRFLGMVEGFGVPIEGGLSAAFQKARSAVADLGGNAMYVAQSSQENVVGFTPTNMQNGTVFAEALDCG